MKWHDIPEVIVDKMALPPEEMVVTTPPAPLVIVDKISLPSEVMVETTAPAPGKRRVSKFRLKALRGFLY